VDAEAVCGLTTLTKLRFRETRAMEYDEDDEPVDEVVGEWVLDFEQADDAELSQPQALKQSAAVMDKQVLALSSLTDLTDLNLSYSSARAEGLAARSDKVVTECWKG
jgi:hypothetical protein